MNKLSYFDYDYVDFLKEDDPIEMNYGEEKSETLNGTYSDENHACFELSEEDENEMRMLFNEVVCRFPERF